ncbi:MAG TPA: DUF2000 family protein [Ktedonobacteraceae bacterium]
MHFDTKIALVIRCDLASWQKMNVAAFLASGIAASYPESIGEPYEDASGNGYLGLIGQPILIYGADRAALARVLDRALARGVQPALYTEEMFSTTHDAANRDAVRSVEQENLNLVGIAIRAERKVVDKIVDKLKFYLQTLIAVEDRLSPSSSCADSQIRTPESDEFGSLFLLACHIVGKILRYQGVEDHNKDNLLSYLFSSSLLRFQVSSLCSFHSRC